MGILESELVKQVESMGLSDFEKKALRELMLKGKIGKIWGSRKLKERTFFLEKWIKLDLLTSQGELTGLGREVATPSYLSIS